MPESDPIIGEAGSEGYSRLLYDPIAPLIARLRTSCNPDIELLAE